MEALLWKSLAPSLCLEEPDTVLCLLGTSCPVGGVYDHPSINRRNSEVTLILEWSQNGTGITPVRPQICRKTEKAFGFSKCFLHAFQENKQNIFRSCFLSVCGHHSHNHNRKPLPSHRQRKNKMGLDGSQFKRRQRNWPDRFFFPSPIMAFSPFSPLALSVQSVPQMLCWCYPAS